MFKQEHSKINKLIIIGAGGHAVSVANVALSAGYEIAYFLDIKKNSSSLLGFSVIDDISKLSNISHYDFSIALGDNHERSRIYKEFSNNYSNIRFPSLIHKTAVVSHFTSIGIGTIVMPNAIIGPNSIVGDFCILNTKSSIDHDCAMLDYSSLGPNAVTGGTVRIGYHSSISIGAIVKDNINIGDDSILGANSFLNKNLPNNSLAYGTPAKIIKSINH